MRKGSNGVRIWNRKRTLTASALSFTVSKIQKEAGEMTDSVLTAAKKVAAEANIPWPVVNKYYRALQETVDVGPARDGWVPEMEEEIVGIPKSKGRAVWGAHPNFTARLLIALACADTPEDGRDSLEMFVSASENGDGKRTLEMAMAAALTDEAAALDIESVDFYPETVRVAIISKTRGAVWFWTPQDISSSAGGGNRETPLIRARGVIDGELFNRLRKAIDWRGPGDPPFAWGRGED